jgi:phosphopantetheinyl transferase
MRANVDMAALLRRLDETDLPQAEQELYQAWARREARTKAEGGALFARPADATVAIDIAAPPGYAASVALAGHEPVVRYRTLG